MTLVTGGKGAVGLVLVKRKVSRLGREERRSFDFAQDFGSGLGRPLNASTSLEMTEPEGLWWR